MDTARIRRELAGSIRLLWAREQWLWGGGLAVLAGFVLWVGATGAALNYGADFAGIELSVIDWSSTTTVVFGAVLALWVLAPAALVTYLVDDHITNVSGNVHTHYRVEHPFLLVAPPLALFAVGVGAGVAVGDVPVALAGALVAVGLLTLVRTVAYSYRVFSFSVPVLVQLGLFASLSVTAVALLTGAGILAGRRTFVEAAASGVGDLLGSSSVVEIVTGTTTAGPITVSTLLGLAAALPVGFAVGYILLQSLVGLVSHLRKPDVPRSQLRTGQRYPDFARPISEKTAGGTSDRPTQNSSENAANGGPSADTDRTSTSDPTTSADSSSDDGTATADSGDESMAKDADDVSHTKVFTAPDDGDFEADVPGVDDVPDTDETAVVGGDSDGPPGNDGGYRCPTCAESFEADTDFAYCPTCGTELEPE